MNLYSQYLEYHRSGFLSVRDNYDIHLPKLAYCIKPVNCLKGHKACINTCSFNQYGDRLITGCDDGSIFFWNIETRKQYPILRIRPHISNIFTTNFLTNNKIISGGNDGNVNLIEINQNSEIICTKYKNHHTRKVLSSYIIDENVFVTCGYDCSIRLFDIRQNYSNSEITNLQSLTEADFDYDNVEEMLTETFLQNKIYPPSDGGGSYDIPQYDNKESLLVQVANEEENELFSLDGYPNDRKQFICSTQGNILWYDLRNIMCGNKNQTIGFNVSNEDETIQCVSGVSFNESGTRIAANVFGEGVLIFDTDKQQKISMRPPRTNHITNYLLGFENDLYIDDSEFIIHHFQNSINRSLIRLSHGVNNNEHISEYSNTSSNSESNDISSIEEEEEEENDGISSYSSEESYSESELYNQRDNIIAQLSSHSSIETIKDVDWYGNYVITGSDDGSIFFYNPDSQNVVNIIKKHENNVNVVKVHRERMFLATSGVDPYAILWEPKLISKINKREAKERIENLLSNLQDCNVE